MLLVTHNLRQIERVAANGVEHQVLQLVDRGEQILAEGRHCNGRLLEAFFFLRLAFFFRPWVSLRRAYRQAGGAREMQLPGPSEQQSKDASNQVRFVQQDATRRLALGWAFGAIGD
jgi:hypothetical protein